MPGTSAGFSDATTSQAHGSHGAAGLVSPQYRAYFSAGTVTIAGIMPVYGPIDDRTNLMIGAGKPVTDRLRKSESKQDAVEGLMLSASETIWRKAISNHAELPSFRASLSAALLALHPTMASPQQEPLPFPGLQILEFKNQYKAGTPLDDALRFFDAHGFLLVEVCYDGVFRDCSGRYGTFSREPSVAHNLASILEECRDEQCDFLYAQKVYHPLLCCTHLYKFFLVSRDGLIHQVYEDHHFWSVK